MADDKKTDSGDNTAQRAPDESSAAPRSFTQTLNPGYVVAGGATVVNTGLAVNKNFRKTLQAKGATKFIDEAYAEAIEKHGVESPKKKDAAEAFEATAQEHAGASRKEMEKALERTRRKLEKNIEHNGEIKNIFQKFARLPDYYQLQIATTLVAVTAVALGAIYSFTRERHLIAQNASNIHQQIAQNPQNLQQQITNTEQPPKIKIARNVAALQQQIANSEQSPNR